MKQNLILLAMGFALTTQIITAQVPSYVPTDGLAGWWGFNGNANDVSVNANNGTATGAALTVDRFGNPNSAYSFNGSSNYIQIPNSSSLQNIDKITISAWVNINSWYQSGGSGYFPILHKSDQQGKYGLYSLTLKDNGGIDHLGNQENGLNYPNWSFNNWYNVILVIANNTNKVYVNGVLVADAASGVFPNSFNNALPLLIGIDKPGLVEYANGKIDDIGIWNRALTQDEINNLYNANICYQNITVTDTLIINTGILSYNPVTYNSTVTIYPNPANDHITIDCGNLANVTGYKIKIFNELGQEVFNGAMNQQQYSVPLNTWTGKGMYLVKIYDASNNVVNTKKIILQ